MGLLGMLQNRKLEGSGVKKFIQIRKFLNKLKFKMNKKQSPAIEK